MNSPSPSRRDFLRSAAGAITIASLPRSMLAAATSRDMTTRSYWTMGTAVRLCLPTGVPASVYADAFSRLRAINDRLSAHDASSEVGQLNALGQSGARASTDMRSVVGAAIRYGRMTDGAIDVTIAPAMRRLGFLPPIPGPAEEVIDYRALALDAEQVRLRSGGYEVDFGGIAKGYGLDESVAILRGHGITTALLEAGGDLFALGRPRADRRWRVGIRDPFRPAEILGTIEIENQAVATSGLYAQTRTALGRTVTHIIDPATGTPATHVLSATIVAPSAMEADALATATSVMPRGKAQALVAGLEGVEGLWIYSDGSTHTSKGLTTSFRWIRQ